MLDTRQTAKAMGNTIHVCPRGAGSTHQEGHDHNDQRTPLAAYQIHHSLRDAVGAACGGQGAAHGGAGQGGEQVRLNNRHSTAQEGGEQASGPLRIDAEGKHEDRQQHSINPGDLCEAQCDEDGQTDDENDQRACRTCQKFHKYSPFNILVVAFWPVSAWITSLMLRSFV